MTVIRTLTLVNEHVTARTGAGSPGVRSGGYTAPALLATRNRVLKSRRDSLERRVCPLHQVALGMRKRVVLSFQSLCRKKPEEAGAQPKT